MKYTDMSIDVAMKATVNFLAKSPIRSLVFGVLFYVLLGGGIYIIYQSDKKGREQESLLSQDYQMQIQQLNATEQNIKKLLQFVDAQRKTLGATQVAISSLRAEQEVLKPLVESDRAVVEALFKAQEVRNEANVWRERFIGFGFGLLASILTSITGYLAKKIWILKRNKAYEA